MYYLYGAGLRIGTARHSEDNQDTGLYTNKLTCTTVLALFVRKYNQPYEP